MKFEELVWHETTDMRGNVNRIQATAEIKIGDIFIMHTLFTVYEDNNDVMKLGVTGSFEHDKPKYPVNTFENGKFLANEIYQENMKAIYNSINSKTVIGE